MTDGVLYRWPPAARLGRQVPKASLNGRVKLPASVREKLVSEVQRITWAYKLAETTIRLRGSVSVPEIQVFHIDVKEDDVDDLVLAAIDKAVRFPIIFEINRYAGAEASVRMAAAFKDVGGKNSRSGPFSSTAWLPATFQRHSLPTSIDLATLYEALLLPLLPIPAFRGEGLAHATKRLEESRRLEREIAVLQRKLRTERQLNRRVELRRKIEARGSSLTALTHPEPA